MSIPARRRRRRSASRYWPGRSSASTPRGRLHATPRTRSIDGRNSDGRRRPAVAALRSDARHPSFAKPARAWWCNNVLHDREGFTRRLPRRACCIARFLDHSAGESRVAMAPSGAPSGRRVARRAAAARAAASCPSAIGLVSTEALLRLYPQAQLEPEEWRQRAGRGDHEQASSGACVSASLLQPGAGAAPGRPEPGARRSCAATCSAIPR